MTYQASPRTAVVRLVSSCRLGIACKDPMQQGNVENHNHTLYERILDQSVGNPPSRTLPVIVTYLGCCGPEGGNVCCSGRAMGMAFESIWATQCSRTRAVLIATNNKSPLSIRGDELQSRCGCSWGWLRGRSLKGARHL